MGVNTITSMKPYRVTEMQVGDTLFTVVSVESDRAREPEDIYAWQQRTMADILAKMEYLGHTVNFKTQKKSYKSKKGQ